MNPDVFLLENLKSLANSFPGVSFRYEYEKSFKEHIIEVSPLETYDNNEAYGNAEYALINEFIKLFPTDTVAFVGEESLIKIKLPTHIIKSKLIISSWMNEINFNNFTIPIKEIMITENTNYNLAA